MLVSLALSGCVQTRMLSTPSNGGYTSAYAPVNESSRGGVIRYRNGRITGPQARESAYQQMYAACGGKYRIDWEGPQDRGAVTTAYRTPYGHTAYSMPVDYWYIGYSCVRTDEPSSEPEKPGSVPPE